MNKIVLTGSYHDKPLDVFISKTVKPTNAITIFVNGLYGVFSPLEDTDKLNMLVKKFIDRNVCHCLNYNSSRDFQYGPEMGYKERQEAFKDKTFQQELDDLKTIISWAIDNSKRVFNIDENNLIINIHGNSLGGTLAILLSEFFSRIQKISLCGSGCGTNGSNKPILSTQFDEKIILESVSHFPGNLLLLQGGEDTTVPLESGIKILDHAVNAKKEHLVIQAANHNFSKINDVATDEAKIKFVDVIFDFISKM